MTAREIITSVVARRSREMFLIDANTGREITYGEFHRLASNLAAELRRRGAGRGDRIAVMLPNSCELAIFYFACVYLGSVIVPINPLLSWSDVEFIVESCKPAMIVAGISSISALQALHKNIIPLLTAQDSSAAGVNGGIRIDELPNASEFVPLDNATDDDPIVIMYTSGTSAKPKGLAHRLGRMVRNASAFAKTQKIGEDSRFYLTLSMAYMGGFYNLLLLPFLCGASVVVDHVFDARSSLHFWEKAKRNRVNALWMAPTVLSILLRMDRGRTGEDFCRNDVRHAFVGFAPLSLRVKNEFERRYGVRLIENYGLSETLFVTARSGEGETSGYVGEPLPGIALRVLADNQEPVATGDDGEVQILTPDLMAGYLDANGNLLEMDSGQWFSTGDVGHVDQSGALSITGRKKDLIIRGGVNISPAAVEETLLQVEGVADASVVSIPHELYGEDIVAVLKLDTGLVLESMLESLISHARMNLAQHQQPARYVAIDEFPRTSNGKVQKTRLRQLVAEKLHVHSLSDRANEADRVGAAR